MRTSFFSNQWQPSFPLFAIVFLSMTKNAMALQYQASIYGGGTSTTFENLGQLTFSGETDQLNPTSTLDTKATVGVATAVRTDVVPESLKKLIQEISFGPEFFYFSGSSSGDVWQYELPEMNNLTYKISTNSYRVLGTNEMTFKPLAPQTFPFFEWGIGFAANQSSYQEYPRPTYDSPGTSLAKNTQYNFSYTFGGGLKIDISEFAQLKSSCLLTFRYLYAHLGSSDLSPQSHSLVTAPTTLDLYTQTWVAGLTYLF